MTRIVQADSGLEKPAVRWAGVTVIDERVAQFRRAIVLRPPRAPEDHFVGSLRIV